MGQTTGLAAWLEDLLHSPFTDTHSTTSSSTALYSQYSYLSSNRLDGSHRYTCLSAWAPQHADPDNSNLPGILGITARADYFRHVT